MTYLEPRTATGLREALVRHLTYTIGKDADHATLHDWRLALSFAVRDRIVDSWFRTTRAAYDTGAKRVYYLSMEFLIGRLLKDALINLRIDAEALDAVKSLGLDFDMVLGDEPDAALGNGGLGRLAACFLESMSTVGCPGFGYGIRYEHGLFAQSFENGEQVEKPETWLRQRHPWEFERPEAMFSVGFGGAVQEAGSKALWQPGEAVLAEAYDTPVVGWKGRWTNTLRLWGARAVDPLDLDRFNVGDFVGAAAPATLARTISRVLYPDDSTDAGRELRLKQEYFFTSASLRDILRRYDYENRNIRDLPKFVAIQLNDTHPAIAGPELVRILHDERGLPLTEAVELARGTLSYTNHTLLPEALEKWSEDLMSRLLPRHMTLIERIDALHAKQNPTRKTAARSAGHVNMGELSFVMAHKVNGVSALHTELMKKTVFGELHRLHPERIVNQTNGVTPRRWMLSSNPRLSKLISETIGDGWVDELERLSDLAPHAEDAGFRDAFAATKRANKADLADWMHQTHGISVDPDAMFDIQIKRIHEYKRQHLNILEAIALWHEIRANPDAGWTPRVKIFGGKAAPAYVFAKKIIRLINDAAEVINADPVTSKYLKVVFLPNYNVSLAERLIPAANLSEQISTAGKEASGTGNMKFAMNGALTVGTLDGANVEIRERVGSENFYLFGMTADEVVARRRMKDHAAQAVAADNRLKAALDAIRDGTFSATEPDRYHEVTSNLMGPDYFLVCSDFTDYWRVQRKIDADYHNHDAWSRKAILNIAGSGWFSSDRTIRGYMEDIWGAKAL